MDNDEDILTMHGDYPGTKADGTIRLIYENVNGINNRMANNPKLDRAKEIINYFSADLVAYCELRMNFSHRSTVNGLRKLFQGGESEVRALAGHNTHANVGRIQEGGTGMIVFGSLIDQYDSENSGRDASGLGRWTYMTFQGRNGITTRVVCGYNPCKTRSPGVRTAYQQ